MQSSRISDTGTGIDAEALPKIFDMFFRGEQMASVGGTGLGVGLQWSRHW